MKIPLHCQRRWPLGLVGHKARFYMQSPGLISGRTAETSETSRRILWAFEELSWTSTPPPRADPCLPRDNTEVGCLSANSSHWLSVPRDNIHYYNYLLMLIYSYSSIFHIFSDTYIFNMESSHHIFFDNWTNIFSRSFPNIQLKYFNINIVDIQV